MDRARMRSYSGTDRISNLPSNVLNHIFRYLPLHDAVSTSILSRGWRYKWVTIPCLVFDSFFQQKLRGNYDIEFVIYQILLLHKGPIVEFTLELADNFRPAINHWFHFLSYHHIEKLTFWFSHKPSVDHSMPYHLFNFDQLRHLCLVNAELRVPFSFKGFGRLVRLHLMEVLIVPGELRRFISKCPMLEYLDLTRHHTSFGDIEIDAPNLKSFAIEGEFSSICFKYTSLLEEISISLYQGIAVTEFQDLESNFIKFFGGLSSIKRVILDGVFLQFLEMGGALQKLADNLSHLIVLHLHKFNFATIAEVSSALWLIRSSPNLRSLKITSINSCYFDAEDTAQFLKKQQECKLTLSHLENVEIYQFGGSKAEMEFVKLLLSSATALLKLEICSVYEGETVEESLMLKELAKFRRASSRAEIVIQDSSNL